MIDVLTTTVDEVLDAAEPLGGVQALVSPSDLEAARARVAESARRRTLAGRLALRLLVSARLGRDPRLARSLHIDRGCPDCGEQHGRPSLTGLSVSTSTSGARVLAAVAEADARIGVDVEVVPDELWAGFDAYTLHPDETVADGVAARISRWTEKEAVLKAAGVGLRVEPSAFRFADGAAATGMPSGAGGLDPGAWRAVEHTSTPALAALSVTTLPTDDSTRAAVAATVPQPLRLSRLDAVLPA
jgi:4'-phosphopantetheinyl transferase